MRFTTLVILHFLGCFILSDASASAGDPDGTMLRLQTRVRDQQPEGSGQFRIVYKTVEWDPKKTAIIICDMWNTMRCKIPADRVAEMAPHMNEFEKYWCPTITSTDLLDKPAFRFQEDERPRIAFIVSDDHYHADKTLPVFAQMLRDRYSCDCSMLHGEGEADIRHTAELETADCLVLYVRRLALPKSQLDRIRTHVESGRPLVALRTANHAFAARYKYPEGYQTPEGRAEWPEFDAEVLGGNYHGHGPNQLGTDVTIVPDQAAHPVLAGLGPQTWHSTGSLYYTSPVKQDNLVLMNGSVEDRTEPLTWVRTHCGTRVVYTGLGHPDDFEQAEFRKLLVNMIFWSMDRPVPEPYTIPPRPEEPAE